MNKLKESIAAGLERRNISDPAGVLTDLLLERFSEAGEWSKAVTFDEAIGLLKLEAAAIQGVLPADDPVLHTAAAGATLRSEFDGMHQADRSEFIKGGGWITDDPKPAEDRGFITNSKGGRIHRDEFNKLTPRQQRDFCVSNTQDRLHFS